MSRYSPARKPTIYFIGVTTLQSSIMKVFPAWAKELGLGDVQIIGVDFPLHAPSAAYREVVQFIRQDRLSLGALITTHKIDLFAAARDLFDEIDPFATLLGETSCISKRNGKLICHAKDPISSGLAIDGFLEPGYFAGSGAEVFSIGAGGSTIALTWHLMRNDRGVDVPSRIFVSDRSGPRLEEIQRIHDQIETSTPCEYVLTPEPSGNDEIVRGLKPGSLIINATGLGKDAPGSPLSDAVIFPERAVIWDLNYRGDLVFLRQAQTQEQSRRLTVVDGWTYFIHGWTQVIAEVFDIAIGTDSGTIDRLGRAAAAAVRT